MNESIQLRSVGRYVYDVFAGQGFDNWTRVRKHHWGVNVIAGHALTRQECARVEVAIKANPHGAINAVSI